ncbi:hypothetical protein PTMSG1_09516 [Pyrenophora teres f. maculata]|nr:hypothetical protein PTMSG1_09516 [Pyrenophora teres f. maculata]
MPSSNPRIISRTLSSISRLSRGMVEPHPFARNAVTTSPHAWRAGDLMKRLGKTSAAYVPFYVVLLGWPLGAKWALNGRL